MCRKLFKKINNLIITGVIIFPIFLGFFLVYKYGVNFIFMDEWEIVKLMKNVNENGFSFHQFISQHNEHRIFFPRLILVYVSLLTKYDSKVLMYITQFMMVCVLFIFWRQFYKKDRNLIFFIPFSYLVFNYGQYENFLWGFQVGFAMTLLFSLISLFFVSRYINNAETKYLVLGIAGGIVASFSSAHGLFVWISGTIILFLSRKNNIIMKITWLFFALLTFAFYFRDYGTPEASKVPFDRLKNLVAIVKFFITTTGSSLSYISNYAFEIGIVLIIITVISGYFVYKKKEIADNSFWIGIILFGFIAVASMSFGRTVHGLEGALNSRYTTISMLIPIGLYGMGLNLFLKYNENKVRFSYYVMLGIIIFFIPSSYENGLLKAQDLKDEHLREIVVLKTYKTQPADSLRPMYPMPERIRETIEYAEKMKYNIFARTDFLTSASALKYSGESIETGLKLENLKLTNSNEEMYISIYNAWAFDLPNYAKAKAVFLCIDGLGDFLLFSDGKRRDISEYFNNKNLYLTGIEGSVNLSGINFGDYEMYLKVVSFDEAEYYTSNEHFILRYNSKDDIKLEIYEY